MRAAPLVPALIALAAALAPAAAAGQDLPTRSDDPGLYAVTPPDLGATAWACNGETLASGASCAFEGDASPRGGPGPQKRANLAALDRVVTPACTAAARPDPKQAPMKDLYDLCRRDVAKLHELCDLAGRAALLDGTGRFTLDSKACYTAVGEALRDIQRIAATSAGCCRCAAAAGCVTSPRACFRFLAEDPPVLPPCAASDCNLECYSLLPPPARTEPAPATAKDGPGKDSGKDGRSPARDDERDGDRRRERVYERQYDPYDPYGPYDRHPQGPYVPRSR